MQRILRNGPTFLDNTGDNNIMRMKTDNTGNLPIRRSIHYLIQSLRDGDYKSAKNAKKCASLYIKDQKVVEKINELADEIEEVIETIDAIVAIQEKNH